MFEMAITLDPNNAHAYYNKGNSNCYQRLFI